MNAWQQQLLARLPEPIRRDAKKSAVLAGLGVVMVAVVLKQFVFTGTSSEAIASVVSTVAAVTNVGSASTSSAPRVDPVEQWLLEPIKPLDRNVFEFHPEFFPNADAGTEATATVVEDDLFWDRLAKSIASRADQRKQKQIRIENLQVAAGKLRVQSTIMGASPRVLIGGKMSRVGDSVEADGGGGEMLSFRILRIEGRRIILEREGVKLELPMGANRARVIVEDE